MDHPKCDGSLYEDAGEAADEAVGDADGAYAFAT